MLQCVSDESSVGHHEGAGDAAVGGAAAGLGAGGAAGHGAGRDGAPAGQPEHVQAQIRAEPQPAAAHGGHRQQPAGKATGQSGQGEGSPL